MRLWIPHRQAEGKKRFLIGLIALVLSWLLSLLLQLVGFNQQFDQNDLDRYTRTAPSSQQYSERITIIAVTDDDYHSHKFNSQSPLNQDKVLELVKEVQAYHPSVVGVDLLTGDWRDKLKSGDTLPAPPIVWARAGREREDTQMSNSIPSIEGTGVAGFSVPPLGMCYASPVNRPDSDGTIRRYLTAVNWEGANEQTWFVRPTMARVLASPLREGKFDCEKAATQDAKLISFVGTFHRFRRIAASVVFLDHSHTLLERYLRDRVVLIGGTFEAARDRWWCSRGYLDGVEILAHSVESEISGEITEPGWWQSAGLSVSVSLFFFLGLYYVPEPWDTLGSAVGPIIAVVLIGYFLYNFVHFFLGIATWMISVPISTAVQHYVELADRLSSEEN
jgi:CHASE2 domain-containing sensor protein